MINSITRALLIIVLAYVTMYGPTGNKMANGQYPYVGAVACPRNIKLGTKVKIKDKLYTCADRTAKKYDGRYDIFSTGTRAEMLKFGKQKLEVKILSNKL